MPIKVAIVMCRHRGGEWDAKGSHGRHSMVVVPIDTPGVKMVRALKVFGYDDAPHGHAEVELRYMKRERREGHIAVARLGFISHYCCQHVCLGEIRRVHCAVCFLCSLLQSVWFSLT